MDTAIAFQPELIRRYSGPAPRYTSYPTAVQFTSAFDAAYRKVVHTYLGPRSVESYSKVI